MSARRVMTWVAISGTPEARCSGARDGAGRAALIARYDAGNGQLLPLPPGDFLHCSNAPPMGLRRPVPSPCLTAPGTLGSCRDRPCGIRQEKEEQSMFE